MGPAQAQGTGCGKVSSSPNGLGLGAAGSLCSTGKEEVLAEFLDLIFQGRHEYVSGIKLDKYAWLFHN